LRAGWSNSLNVVKGLEQFLKHTSAKATHGIDVVNFGIIASKKL